MGKKKIAKNKVAEKKATEEAVHKNKLDVELPKKQQVPEPDAELPEEQQVPESIRDRAARMAKKRTEMEKAEKKRREAFPEGSVEKVRDNARSKARHEQTGSPLHDQATWADVLSHQILILIAQNRELARRIEKLEKNRV